MGIGRPTHDHNDKPFARRDFLRGSLRGGPHPASGFLPLAPPRAPATTQAGRVVVPPRPTSPTPTRSAGPNSTTDAVIFNGGYGIAYTEFAAKQMEALQAGSTVKVTPATNIAQTLQPRFVAGNPPDVIDNSGAGLIGINTIRDQLEDLTDVLEAQNYEGVVIKDTLYAGVTESGTFDGKFSSSTRPHRVRAVVLGVVVQGAGLGGPQDLRRDAGPGPGGQGKDKYLLRLGKEAATYYQTMATARRSSRRRRVRLALENLKRTAGSPAVRRCSPG